MTSPLECSSDVLDTMPLLMRAIRTEMRREREPDLTVPQFRALAFVYHESGPSLSQTAEHVGLTLSAMSKIVDGLVERGMIARTTCADDRRRVGLALTRSGRATFEATRKRARARLAELFEPMTCGERELVAKAMRVMTRVLGVAGQQNNGSTRQRRRGRQTADKAQ